jgi:hypothetical protein
MKWSLRGLHWTYCAFIAWASVQTFLAALPGRDLHALLLSSVEVIAIVAFLFDRLAAPSCAVLCAVLTVAAVITSLNGHASLDLAYYAATAIFILTAKRSLNGQAGLNHAERPQAR